MTSKMKPNTNEILQRKKDHLKIALSPGAQIGDPGFSRYHFPHHALPEVNFSNLDTSNDFLGKKVSYPFFISCMTGGVEEGQKINENLAKAAQKYNIAMGVGSQRAAVEHPELRKLFEIRKYAPDIPVMANVGLVQLNYGFGLKEILTVIDMVKADALVFHINPIQELIQPEGDKNFEQLLTKLKKLIKEIPVPVIAKEVGFGLSESDMENLYNIGVRVFDTAGWGGTNWAYIEGMRRSGRKDMGNLFSSWGIPTTESILTAASLKNQRKAKDMVIFGSGGIRNGVDIAKALCLGADFAGIAAPFAQAALKSETAVGEMIERLGYELKVVMMGTGVSSIKELKKIQLKEL
jgi:isopentenyl-diphosphate delta-isomerase